MKKLITLLVAVFISFQISAQTDQGNMLAGANSNFNFNSSKADGADEGFATINFDVLFGYFLADNIAGGLSLSYFSYDGESDVGFGLFGRYYLMDSKLFLHAEFGVPGEDMTKIGFGAGYVIWLNDNVSIQPSLMYGMYSYDGEPAYNALDLNVGFGLYF